MPKFETIREIYNIENKIKEALDCKVGYVKKAYEVRRFNELYDSKHKEKEYNGNVLEYEAKRVYTMGRYFNKYYKIGEIKQMPMRL